MKLTKIKNFAGNFCAPRRYLTSPARLLLVDNILSYIFLVNLFDIFVLLSAANILPEADVTFSAMPCPRGQRYLPRLITLIIGS
jgi:hypothetical protein